MITVTTKIQSLPLKTIIERDELINELEAKILNLSKEMMSSTDIMNKLAHERESIYAHQSGKTKKNCCEEIKQMLEKSNQRFVVDSFDLHCFTLFYFM